jgi:glycosyltransferase involved in cell wall biosynthesis
VIPDNSNGRLIGDDRWRGVSGIGRFAAEVFDRARTSWTSMEGGAPWLARDVLNPQRLKLPSDNIVFSPGYNCGVTRAAQVLTLHDLMHLRSEASVSKKLYYEHVVRRAVRDTGLVLTVSETSRQDIREWVRDDSVEVLNVGNGISQAFFPRPNREPVAKRRRSLLFVGNMKRHKNFPLVLSVLRKLKDWTLFVVTTDPSVAASQISAAGLSARVHVIAGASDDELALLYRSTGVLIMPSSEEGFGLPAVEATSVGATVVYWAGCRAIRDSIGQFGVAVDRIDQPDAWAEAIVAVDGGRPRESRDEWRSQFAWESVASNVWSAVETVAMNRRGGA